MSKIQKSGLPKVCGRSSKHKDNHRGEKETSVTSLRGKRSGQRELQHTTMVLVNPRSWNIMHHIRTRRDPTITQGKRKIPYPLAGLSSIRNYYYRKPIMMSHGKFDPPTTKSPLVHQLQQKMSMHNRISSKLYVTYLKVVRTIFAQISLQTSQDVDRPKKKL